MRWFRFHSETLNNAKVQALEPDIFKGWVNVLCVACARQENGYLASEHSLAFSLRIPVKRVKLLLRELDEAGLLEKDGDRYRVHDWDAWNYEETRKQNLARVHKYRKVRSDAGLGINGYIRHKESVLKRDGRACVYCGSGEKLVIDHVIPVLKGGDDEPMNLATACKACNSGKAGRTPEEAGYRIRSEAPYFETYKHNVTRLKSVTHSVTGSVTHSVTGSVNTPVTASVYVSVSESESDKYNNTSLPETRFQAYFDRHPGSKTRYGACKAEYSRIVDEAVDPVQTADALDRDHSAWVKYWAATGQIPLGLYSFLRDGDCFRKPPELTEDGRFGKNSCMNGVD